MQRSLSVFFDDRLIGTLAEPRTNKFTFSYAPEATDLVSVRLPWSADRYPPAAVAPLVDAFAPGEARRQELADQHAIPSHLLFRFLELTGHDAPGALRFIGDDDRPADGEPAPLDPAALVEESAVVRHGDTWAAPAPRAPSTHILRFEDELLPGSAAAERYALQLAAAFGIPAPTADVVTVFDIPALVVARPDRVVGDDGTVTRRHLEPFGSVCGLSLDGDADRIYQERGGPGFAEIAEALDIHAADPQAAVRQLVDHMVLHFCLGNTNAHVNTYTLEIPELSLGSVVSLLPAEIYTELVTNEGTFDIDHRLAMTIGGCETSSQVTLGSLVAEAASWPRLRHATAQQAVDEAVERLAAARSADEIDLADVPPRLVELVDERIVRLRP